MTWPPALCVCGRGRLAAGVLAAVMSNLLVQFIATGNTAGVLRAQLSGIRLP